MMHMGYFFINLIKSMLCLYIYVQKVQWDIIFFPCISYRVIPKSELMCLFSD